MGCTIFSSPSSRARLVLVTRTALAPSQTITQSSMRIGDEIIGELR